MRSGCAARLRRTTGGGAGHDGGGPDRPGGHRDIMDPFARSVTVAVEGEDTGGGAAARGGVAVVGVSAR
jgi:hypothetical protein